MNKHLVIILSLDFVFFSPLLRGGKVPFFPREHGGVLLSGVLFSCTSSCLRIGVRTPEICPIRNQNLILLATRQYLVKIDEGQQKIKIVRTNRQSNLCGFSQSIFSLCWHLPKPPDFRAEHQRARPT